MNYRNVRPGTFVKRVNRFIAHVTVDGIEQIVHVKNTGRCKELFLPGVDVLLEPSENPERKTRFSLIGVYKGERLINIDSQVPNQVVFEALTAGMIHEIGTVDRVKKEVTYGKSRFDLYYEIGEETERTKGFIEVKGVTLEEQGVAMFPDAPTVRGTKHIYEMIDAVRNGYEGTLFFLIQMKDVCCFRPNRDTDPDFAHALTIAAENGVRILAYDSVVTEDGIVLGDPVEGVFISES